MAWRGPWRRRRQRLRSHYQLTPEDIRELADVLLRIMWERFKKPAQPKVVFNSGHIWRELTPISKRRLSDDEMNWVTQSLSANKELKDFLAPQLFAVSKCPCGTCRTVGLDPIALPGREDRSGYIGGITIETRNHGPISVLLHASHGF